MTLLVTLFEAMIFAVTEKGETMKTNNYVPCPNCGCKEIIGEINLPRRVIRIHCDMCPQSVYLPIEDYMSFEEMTEAINQSTERWNRRAKDGT